MIPYTLIILATLNATIQPYYSNQKTPFTSGYSLTPPSTMSVPQSSFSTANYSTISPQEHVESLKGERVTVALQGNVDIEGTLRGYDSFLNLLLEDVIETTHTTTGPKTTKVDKIFLVSMRVIMITKGTTKPYVAAA